MGHLSDQDDRLTASQRGTRDVKHRLCACRQSPRGRAVPIDLKSGPESRKQRLELHGQAHVSAHVGAPVITLAGTPPLRQRPDRVSPEAIGKFADSGEFHDWIKGSTEVTAMSQAVLRHEAFQQFVPAAGDEPNGEWPLSNASREPSWDRTRDADGALGHRVYRGE